MVLAAPCGGGSERAAVARPQVVRVGTTEIDGYSGIGFRLEIRRLVITSQGWRVEARVTNSTATIWTIGRPHVPKGTKFGLFVAATVRQLQALRLEASGHTTPPLIATRSRRQSLACCARATAGRVRSPERARYQLEASYASRSDASVQILRLQGFRRGRWP